VRHRLTTLGLVLLAYGVALVQRPGELVAETKVDLYLEPARFVERVLSVWAPTGDLGHLFGAQYSGYLWPMGPWFALGDALGVPMWLVHRLWLGTLLALAGWGVVRLLDALVGPRRGALHAAAGVLYVINPYVTVYVDRTSITLLAYAALPWLLLAVHRALREPRGWRWPAFFALVLTSTGGGVNVAVTAWLLLGPLLLAAYERLWGEDVPPRALRQVAWRMAAVNVAAQLWWVVPVAVQAMAAPSFLPFTEQPGTIWSTTSLPETLRLMGFWTSYVGVGFGGVLRPFQASGPALLLLLPVVIAGLLIPALALGAFTLTRRRRYVPFFALMLLVGLVVMTVGWPEGTPLRRLATAAYYRVESLQFARTTYKAGALVALAIAVLGGAAFAAGWARLRGRAARAALAACGAALVALASWPLVSGRAPEPQLSIDMPDHWRQVARDLDERRDEGRALLLPGQLFAYYAWGGTVDAVLPTLTDRPVATRWVVPYADLRATDMQWTVDRLVTQDRLVPGQLPPLLDLLGVGDVVIAADGDRSRSGEGAAADVARTLAAQGLRGGTAYGPTRTAQPAAGSADEPLRVPSLRRVGTRTGGLVRLLPRGPLTVVDGGGGGIAALAAFDALDPRRPLAYAPDLGPDGVRAAVRDGAAVVISDTNRRQAFVASRSKGSAGPVLPADEGVSVDGTMLDPWVGSPDAQTVQLLRGVRSVTAPSSPQVTQFPERRPYAALDGDPSTAWMADRFLTPDRHRLTVTLERPRDIAYIDLLPYSDSRGEVREVEVAGRRFKLRRGWNRLRLDLRGARELTVRLTEVSEPKEAAAGAGGIRELRIPGVSVSETLRPPVLAADALRGSDLSRSPLTYLLQRFTADMPRRQSRYVGERGAGLLRDAQDPERQIARTLHPPAARRYRVDAWASVDPLAPDDVLDALLAGRARPRAPSAGSSSRFEGRPEFRASGAFDRGGRAWIGQWIAGRPAWIAWSATAPVTVRRLRLRPPTNLRVRVPTRVALSVDGRRAATVDVGDDGSVVLPRAVRGRTFHLDILAARFPAGTPGRERRRRAVGIGEIEGAGMPALSAPRTGAVDLACGTAAIEVGGRRVALGGRVDRAALERGEPLRLRACGGEVALPARPVELRGLDAPLRVDALRLHSAAPEPLATAASDPGRVLDSGRVEGGEQAGVRLAVREPSWLVLGQSYDRNWRARCDGRDLGEPRPMQGYANAWPVEPGCADVTFTYAPQRLVTAGYAISAAGILALLVVAAVGFARRRPTPVAPAADLPAPEPPRPLPARRALLLALAPAVAVAFMFGLRAGAVALPALWLVLWRGVSDRALGRLVALLLGVAVPVAYAIAALIHRGESLGGNSTDYANERIGAHWPAVAAIVALAVVLWRTLSTARGRGADEPGSGS
jgi:hypothetical protein